MTSTSSDKLSLNNSKTWITYLVFSIVVLLKKHKKHKTHQHRCVGGPGLCGMIKIANHFVICQNLVDFRLF